jgi:hypothetical protein
MMRHDMAKRARMTPWALLLFWTGLILTGDTVYVVTSWRQHAATGFSQTTGKIAQSALGQGPLGRRGLRLRYTYAVHGVNYTGFRYRYDDANVGVRYDKVLEEFPAHTLHPIYYNPDNPGDSLLAPGVDGCDLLLVLVAAPFNVATFAVWVAFLNYRRRHWPSAQAGNVKIIRQTNEVRALLAETSALTAGLYGLGIAAAVEASLVIASWGFGASKRLMAGLWAVALAAGLAAAILKFVKNKSGCYDLILDFARGTVTLPQMSGRPAPATVPRADVAAVIAQRRVSVIPSGRHYSYVPALLINEGGGRPSPLARWGWSEGRAQAFCEWLALELGAEFQGTQDEKVPTPTAAQVPV